MLFGKVLNKKQKSLIKRLVFLNKYRCYLAGGTSLALQIGHRTSLDFDFYTHKHFNSQELADLFRKEFNKVTFGNIAKDTLFVDIDEVNLSLFYYPYKLIKGTSVYEGIELASLPDIAAMKVAAVVQRGVRRDFIDIYYLLRMFTLEEIINFALKKFPTFQSMIILKALIYFTDAEEEDLKRGIMIFDKDFSWKRVKAEILTEVRKYQLDLLK